MQVGQTPRAQDGADRRRPLHGHELVLPQENVAHVLCAQHADGGGSEQMRLVDVSVLSALQLEEFAPLQYKELIRLGQGMDLWVGTGVSHLIVHTCRTICSVSPKKGNPIVPGGSGH